MMEKIRLGDLVNTSSGATPLSSNKEYYENGDIPWINSGEVGQYKINFAEKFITKEGFEKSNTKIFPKDTILVAMYGATAGKTSILNINACTNQAVCAILPSENVNNIFLKYKLDSIYDYLVQISSGSARDNLSQKVIQDLEINLPLLETQQKIAKILSDIDDKIEVLHQINDNLAELAKTIYDYWFVQFDFPDQNGKPYKSSGGKMVYNNVLKREIPEGWEVDNIFNVASIQYGFPFSTEFFNENKIGVPVIRIRDIKDNQISNFSTEEKIDSKYIIKKGEILIGMDGNFHINYWANDNCYLNQRVVKIQGIELSNIYLKEQIEPYIKTREKSISRTTVGHLSDKDLRSINIIIPNNLIMIKINSFYNNTLNKFIENLQQIQHLQSLRDWLLPMLMNGQISVE